MSIIKTISTIWNWLGEAKNHRAMIVLVALGGLVIACLGYQKIQEINIELENLKVKKLTVQEITGYDGLTDKTILQLGSFGAPACLMVADLDGGGWSYGTILDGVITWSTESCEY